MIAEFQKRNNTFPDEPDMPESQVDKLLATTKHLNPENVGGISCVPDLRTQLYAQTRALQFSKFGIDLPQLVCSSCGPKTRAAATCQLNGAAEVSDDCNEERSDVEPISKLQHPRDVVECISSLVDMVAKEDAIKLQVKINASLPPLLTGEYDAVIPITSKGLMMNVGEIHGTVAFLGYRQFPDGTKGPSEITKLVRNVGDKIIAVDGVSTVDKSFQEVILLLKESGKQKYAFMRFLETKFSACQSKLTSVGSIGRYAIEELQKKFSTDRERLLVRRKQQLANAEVPPDEAEESDGSAVADSSDESDEDSDGGFRPDSDAEDDDLMKKRRLKSGQHASPNPVSPGRQEKGAVEGTPSSATKVSPQPMAVEKTEKGAAEPIVLRHETTRSLAYRLLDIDIGNSSDEGGDDDCAYYLDGVDDTFTSMETAHKCVKSIIDEELVKVKSKKDKEKDTEVEEESTVPVKRNEFSELGERAKLTASVLLAKKPPLEEDFDNFPYRSTKDLAIEASQNEATEAEASGSPEAKSTKRSTVKIEQIDVSTNETIHVWASAQAIAATLSLPLTELKRMLEGEYDEDLGDEIGGFRWRYALAGAKVTAGLEVTGRGKKGREAWLEFRDKLYDPTEPHLYKNSNRLRDYQVDGVNWLASTYYKRHGCILADGKFFGLTCGRVGLRCCAFRQKK